MIFNKNAHANFLFWIQAKCSIKLFVLLLLFHKKPIQTVSSWENLTKPVKNTSESYFIQKIQIKKTIKEYSFLFNCRLKWSVVKKGTWKKLKITFCMKKIKPFFKPRSYLSPKSKEKYVLHYFALKSIRSINNHSHWFSRQLVFLHICTVLYYMI